MKKSLTFSIVFVVEVLALCAMYLLYLTIGDNQTPIAEPSSQERSVIVPEKLDFTYEVKPGDSLWNIAKKFNLTVNTLSEENNLQKDSILKIGQKIIIPKKTLMP